MNGKLEWASKFMNCALRNSPEMFGISLDSEGWAEITELVRHSKRHAKDFGKVVSRELILEVIATSGKEHFTLSPDGSRVRANQVCSVQAKPLSDSEKYQIAAQAIRAADGLLIVAGGRMSEDFGLPVFSELDGFWRTYPPPPFEGSMNYQRMISSQDSFIRRPTHAWGFYGHLLNLYRNTVPHEGYRLLHEMAAELPQGAFITTVNVDGLFQKAGFSDKSLREACGSIHYLQCVNNCELVWLADEFRPEIDAKKRLTSSLPRCPQCGALARPNIIKCCGDRFDYRLHRIQDMRYATWLHDVKNLVTIEIGSDFGQAKFGGSLTCGDTERRGFTIHIPSVEESGIPVVENEDFDENWGEHRDSVVLCKGILEGLRGIATALRS